MVKKESLRFSLKGYSFKVWVSKNKDSLKLLVSVLCALIASTWADNASLQVLFATGTGVLTKLLVDAIDFFQAE